MECKSLFGSTQRFQLLPVTPSLPSQTTRGRHLPKEPQLDFLGRDRKKRGIHTARAAWLTGSELAARLPREPGVPRLKPASSNLLLKLLYGLATKIRYQMAWEEFLGDSCAGMPGRILRVYVYNRLFLWRRRMFVRIISFNYSKCRLFLNTGSVKRKIFFLSSFFFLKRGQLAGIPSLTL